MKTFRAKLFRYSNKKQLYITLKKLSRKAEEVPSPLTPLAKINFHAYTQNLSNTEVIKKSNMNTVFYNPCHFFVSLHVDFHTKHTCFSKKNNLDMFCKVFIQQNHGAHSLKTVRANQTDFDQSHILTRE